MSADAIMNETLVEQPCLLCGSTHYTPIKTFEDGVVVGECADCGMLYTPVRHGSPASLLDGNLPEKLRLLHGPIAEERVAHFRAKNFEDYLSRVERHTHGKRLLDVGCAHGFFPRLARSRGYDVMGVEPSPGMVEFAREVLGLQILSGRLDQVDLGDRMFDVVTFTDSLEYFPNPRRDLSIAAEHLVSGGLLFAKVPNGDYFRFWHELSRRSGRHIGNVDGAFGPSRRVAHYTYASLSRLMTLVGLEVVEVDAPLPIHSPVWRRFTGLPLEVEAPWFIGLRAKLMRRTMHTLGRVEARLPAHENHFSQSIYVIGRKP